MLLSSNILAFLRGNSGFVVLSPHSPLSSPHHPGRFVPFVTLCLRTSVPGRCMHSSATAGPRKFGLWPTASSASAVSSTLLLILGCVGIFGILPRAGAPYSAPPIASALCPASAVGRHPRSICFARQPSKLLGHDHLSLGTTSKTN